MRAFQLVPSNASSVSKVGSDSGLSARQPVFRPGTQRCLMTVASKAIVKAFYASAPSRSCFVGCSAGSHIGAMEATRYPKDFDGTQAHRPR